MVIMYAYSSENEYLKFPKPKLVNEPGKRLSPSVNNKYDSDFVCVHHKRREITPIQPPPRLSSYPLRRLPCSGECLWVYWCMEGCSGLPASRSTACVTRDCFVTAIQLADSLCSYAGREGVIGLGGTFLNWNEYIKCVSKNHWICYLFQEL